MTSEISDLKQFLKKKRIRPKKRLSQNFLIDKNLHRFIAKTADVCSDDIILEVGTGTGMLTRVLAESRGTVIGVEIDPPLYAIAKKSMSRFGNVRIICCDALEKSALNSQLRDAIIKEIESGKKRFGDKSDAPKLKVVSNLPYCISTPIIGALLASDLPITLMVLTLQKEVAQRLVAKPATKDYGFLTVSVRAVAEVEIVRAISRNVFWPRPEVDSALVRIVPSTVIREHISDIGFFHFVARAIFTARRKTIANSLKIAGFEQESPGLIGKVLSESNIDPRSRGETLSVEKIIELSERLGKLFLSDSDLTFASLERRNS